MLQGEHAEHCSTALLKDVGHPVEADHFGVQAGSLHVMSQPAKFEPQGVLEDLCS